MQKYCNEVAKNAINALNPGQLTVDTSDQPVYALSRRLQQMFPDSLGPGKYLPMFGGLHIEKLLLEIQASLFLEVDLLNFLIRLRFLLLGPETQWSIYPKLVVLDTCFKCVCLLNVKQ